MKILTLSIKQEYFDAIIAGTKKNEYREIRPNNANRYIKYICDGKEYKANDELPEDGILEALPIKYDAIKFLTGAYKGKRPYIIVEVEDADIELMLDDEGNNVCYVYKSEEYFAARMNYTLGKIVEKSDY